jgi:RNA-splicing ligase RtcB
MTVVDARNVACCNECEWAERHLDRAKCERLLQEHYRQSGHSRGQVVPAPEARTP